MPRAHRLVALVAGSLLAADSLLAAMAAQATSRPSPAPAPVSGQARTTPQFRSDVTLVPLDIRVVDKNGRAVTDLKA